jgi:hypothetical protein
MITQMYSEALLTLSAPGDARGERTGGEQLTAVAGLIRTANFHRDRNCWDIWAVDRKNTTSRRRTKFGDKIEKKNYFFSNHLKVIVFIIFRGVSL